MSGYEAPTGCHESAGKSLPLQCPASKILARRSPCRATHLFEVSKFNPEGVVLKPSSSKAENNCAVSFGAKALGQFRRATSTASCRSSRDHPSS